MKKKRKKQKLVPTKGVSLIDSVFVIILQKHGIIRADLTLEKAQLFTLFYR